jgi:hypothetical protein
MGPTTPNSRADSASGPESNLAVAHAAPAILAIAKG